MALLVSAALPIALWLAFCAFLRSDYYAMDQGYHKGSFFPLLILYSVFGYVVFLASLVISMVEFYNNMFWAPSVLMVAAVDALLFVVFLLTSYESYLHYQADHPEQSNYSGFKYAMTIALGLSAVVTFIMGLVMTAVDSIKVL